MVCELCGHCLGSLRPFAPRRGMWNGDAQRLMRAYAIADRILKGEMAPQERALLRMRPSFPHQAPDPRALGEIVTLDITVLLCWPPSTSVMMSRAPKMMRRRTSTTRPCSRRLSTCA